MPRPSEGYKNATGQKIPGVGDPCKRYMDPGGLIGHAYKQGLAQRPRFEQAALDIGSCVHRMAELDLRGEPDRAIEKCASDYLSAPDHLNKAWTSFRQFREWRQVSHVRQVALEKVLISEKYQYGTTIDAALMFGNAGVGIVEMKTSSKREIYDNQVVELAARGHAWLENCPDLPATSGYHLCIFPKDGSPFLHRYYSAADLAPYFELFKLWLAAYKIEQDLKANGNKSSRSGPGNSGSPISPTPKPRLRVKVTTQRVGAVL